MSEEQKLSGQELSGKELSGQWSTMSDGKGGIGEVKLDGIPAAVDILTKEKNANETAADAKGNGNGDAADDAKVTNITADDAKGERNDEGQSNVETKGNGDGTFPGGKRRTRGRKSSRRKQKGSSRRNRRKSNKGKRRNKK